MRLLIRLALFAPLLFSTMSGQTQDRQLPTVPVNGGGIDGFVEYEEHGSPDGEPLILIQGSVVAEAFRPIANQSSLNSYRILRVHLRSYAGSSPIEAPFGARDHAEDIVALVRGLGIDRAHLVGHSYGGAIAMEVAIDAPEIVGSLVLAEPGTSPRMRGLMRPGQPIPPIEQLREGQQQRIDAVSGTREHRREWLDNFLTGCLGNLEALNVIPGAYEQALTNGLDAIRIQFEYPIDLNSGINSMGNFDPAVHLPLLNQPILFLTGGEPQWLAMAEIYREHDDDIEVYSFGGAPHCFTILQPKEVADVIADFLSGNPI